MREPIGRKDFERVDELCKRLGKSSGTRITVIGPDGVVYGDTEENPEEMDNHANRPEIKVAYNGQIGVSRRFSATLEEEMMYVAVPLQNGDQFLGVVRTSMPLTALFQALDGVQSKLFIGGLVAALLAAGICLAVSRRITRPLEEMRDGAARFARGQFDHKLPVPDTREMGDLAEAMNAMGARLNVQIRRLVRSRNQQKAILSSMVEGVLAVDKEGKILRVNEAAGELLDIDADWARGRTIQEAIRNSKLHDFIGEALTTMQPLERDIAVEEDEDERILEGHGTVLRGDQGEEIGALVVLNDVTRLRQLERMRRDFVANVSHELKTPITSIKGFVETILGETEKMPEDARRFLQIIRSEVDRLNAIITDLLSLSRIERHSENAPVDKMKCNVRKIVDSALESCRGTAEDKNMDIEISCPEGLTVMANGSLLERALANLIDNAVKYSPDGTSVEVVGMEEGDEVIVAVRDEGRGIAPEHQPRIFERFYRVDKGRSRKLGGTGLGLAIVKHIAEVHGGHVELESELGKGSTFSIHLPG
jgi:two-component system phosphate regulon sensor histidine kinase PhoR